MWSVSAFLVFITWGGMDGEVEVNRQPFNDLRTCVTASDEINESLKRTDGPMFTRCEAGIKEKSK